MYTVKDRLLSWEARRSLARDVLVCIARHAMGIAMVLAAA